MLTEEARRDLRRMGVRRQILVKACRKCGRYSGTVSTKHPLDNQISKVKKALKLQPGNQVLESRRHELESLRHHTSYCCGAAYKQVMGDPQEAQWTRWLDRWDEVRASVVPRVLRSNPDLTPEQALIEAIEFMRSQFPSEVYQEDDFVTLSYLWSHSDRHIAEFIRIFRLEEERQKLMLVSEESRPAISA